MSIPIEEDCTVSLNGMICASERNDSVTETDILDAHNLLVHNLIKHECEAHPDSAAVDAWDGSLTYRELNEKSSRLANLLSQHGVGPDVIVPLCFDKSMWTTVSLLAVLKAGGGFMLLDTSLPLDRLRTMCQAVKAAHVLGSPGRAELATSLGLSGAVITVDEEAVAAIQISDVECIAPSMIPANACYVVFTSGSTGKPKGIITSHLSIATSIDKLKNPTHLTRESRVLQFASYAFDVSVLEQLNTLAAGACLCIPSEESRISALSDAFIDFRVDWVMLTPSVARILDPTRLPELRVLFLVGEAITRADIEKWLPHTQVHLMCMYGPAEFAGGATVGDLRSCPKNPSNIGRSYSATCWVVDPEDHSRLVSPGEEGELVLEGPCVSHGYINMTDLNSASFSTSAAWLETTDTRLYYTGDIVRHNPDESLQFLGRKDTQVKLSGQRIELGEVEYHLRKVFPEASGVVAEAVSLLAQGTRSLVAFVHFPSTWEADLCFEEYKEAKFRAMVAKAKDGLRTSLPKYMIPSMFLRLLQIPLTRTGKTDRKRMLAEAQELFKTRSEASASPLGVKQDTGLPDSDAEMLRLLCEKTLGPRLESLRSDVGWLQLGGDSLLAMKLVDQVRCKGYSITVADVLMAESLAKLASKLKRQTPCTAIQEYQPYSLLPNTDEMRKRMVSNALQQCQVGPDALEDLYPCTGLQRNLIPFIVKTGANYMLRLRFWLPAGLDQARLIRAWDYAVASNPILRTRVFKAAEGPYYQALVRDLIPLDLDTDLREVNHGPVPDLFCLGKPLVSASLHEDVLSISMHHLVFDGYCFSLIFRDLDRAYQSANPLPHVSFGPFIQWSTSLDEPTARFWTESFAGFDGKQFPPPPAPGYTPCETTRVHRKIGIRSSPDGFAPSNKLRLALAVAFARILRTDKVVFKEVSARRSAPIAGISEMALPTAGVQPICVRLRMDKPLSKNLERVQNEALQRLDFEGFEMDQLRALSVEADAACDVQALLIIQHKDTMKFPGIFENVVPEYDHANTPCSLALECWLTAESFEIAARIDEKMLTRERTERFLDCLENVFESIFETPEAAPAQLEAGFDI